MRLFFTIFAFTLISCNSEEELKFTKINLYEIKNANGMRLCRLQCLNYCNTDSQTSIIYIYDKGFKLSYIQELEGVRLVNSYSIGYSGDSLENKIMAGYYLFKEYFNNKLISNSSSPGTVFTQYLSYKYPDRQFYSFVDSVMKRNFAIRLDTCEMNNLFLYLNPS